MKIHKQPLFFGCKQSREEKGWQQPHHPLGISLFGTGRPSNEEFSSHWERHVALFVLQKTAMENKLIHHNPSSSIIIHHHPLSSIIIHYHPLSSIIIHYHPLSSIIIHHLHHDPSWSIIHKIWIQWITIFYVALLVHWYAMAAHFSAPSLPQPAGKCPYKWCFFFYFLFSFARLC